MQRTQIYLDDEQHRALAALAKERGSTASALIRSAIDDYLAGQLSPSERLDRLKALGARFAREATDERSDARETVDTIRARGAARLDSFQ
jgi:predicted transcriptional regulator